jgi:hypothetical protein
VNSIYRCQRCHAYVLRTRLEWSEGGYVCRNLERCLRAIRCEIYISSAIRAGKKHERASSS